MTGSDNCTTSVESFAHSVDNTDKPCCPIRSKTLSNKDFKNPWITRKISNIKIIIILCFTVKIKFLNIFILISEILSVAKHKFSAARNYLKQSWRIVSNIINTKRCKVEKPVKKIIQKDVVHEDSEDMAKYL